ncbi:MAG: lysophospholipid acyltransferase family protein [Anaerolineaceae bacterium]|jgi:1-acyl-sn-glycerol-3-phosphate acyltransferase|nr:lysophospholipid acyltransferase family protein [Anaerolineaceae bacterium]
MKESIPTNNRKTRIIKGAVRFLMRIIFRITVEGGEHVPPEGGIIVATNHLSRWDIPLLLMIPNRLDLTGMVTDKYLDYPLIRLFVNLVGGIWLDRDRADFAAFRTAIEALDAGQALGIAPEGTRSNTGGLIEGKPGTILLAIKAQAPVVPTGLSGTEFISKNWWKRPRLTIRFGAPFTLPPLSRENRNQQMQTSTDEMMCRIAALLPEQYRGVYAGHPRLQELLAEDE